MSEEPEIYVRPERTQTEEEAQYIDPAELERVKAMDVRWERDRLLAETDWWGVSDQTMTQAQSDYRKALRDIPQQSGFPSDVTWPTKP